MWVCPSNIFDKSTPVTARILCRSFTPKRHRQLRVKDLPKVPTWRLERDSNPQPFGRKVTNLPMSLHAPQNYTSIHVRIKRLYVAPFIYLTEAKHRQPPNSTDLQSAISSVFH